MWTFQRKASWRSRLKRWMTNLLILCITLLAILSFALISATNSSSKLNARQVFESSRWNALQLQLQTYRLANYISNLSAKDFPLNGDAYFQYDLVLSRIDLLREGEVGHHIHNFSNGRAIRLLNIITGELELISLNLSHLEEGHMEHIDIIRERLHALDRQITDFVVIVNQGANDYVVQQRVLLKEQLSYIKNMALILLLTAILLVLLAIRVALDQRYTFTKNKCLEARVHDAQKEKTEIVTHIASELKPGITSVVGLCTTAEQEIAPQTPPAYLKKIVGLSNQLLTQIDGYQDLVLLETKQFQRQISEGSLRAHIEHTLVSLENLFASHHVRAVCVLDPQLPSHVETDFRRLHELMVTLLTHLLPYCKHSPMAIDIRPSNLPLLHRTVANTGHDSNMVQICLRDKGQGLPEAIQNSLRSSPHNPSNTVIQQINRIGIGFTFCHRLISAMGGELHFSSTKENGTEVWVDIPMSRQDTATTEAQQETSKGRTLAILDSHPLLSQTLKSGIESCHYRADVVDVMHLQTCVRYPDELDFNTLLVSDSTLLDEACLKLLNDLAVLDVHIISTNQIKQQFPELTIHSLIHYPVTQTQLEELLDF